MEKPYIWVYGHGEPIDSTRRLTNLRSAEIRAIKRSLAASKAPPEPEDAIERESSSSAE
jgi:hypothetical protein